MSRDLLLRKRVLKSLQEEHVSNIAKLASNLGVHRSSVSRLLHHLESMGLVKKDQAWELTDLGIEEATKIVLKPDLDTVIFDMMLENEDPPDKATLQKWTDQFPYYEKELRGFVSGWRLMERRSERYQRNYENA